ncbi:galactosyltransferase-related protein [Salinisphaera sp. T31B1]|uniref:glycosyltransferase family 2 protein n=1 Tax=Salinisphaera sp. T31B1 TaxID=727963 RepID=UPI003340D8F9
MKVSVLTLVRGRREHLINFLHGLNAQQRPPDELVIAWMQPAPHAGLPATVFPVRHVMVDGQSLPLAAARNRAAAVARHPGLIFLDVDCIAAPALVGRYAEALDRGPGLYLGEVRYLSAGAVDLDPHRRLDYDQLARSGLRHPARPAPPAHGVRVEPDPGQLWGLSFALTGAAHHAAGGMDEAYVGYGGEETDYAHRLAAAGLRFYWVADALAWHQHHRLHRPPLQHFEAIIANARRFHARWQHWCMDYWLGLFADAGFIEWHPQATRIQVRRHPGPADIDAARLDDSARWG